MWSKLLFNKGDIVFFILLAIIEHNVAQENTATIDEYKFENNGRGEYSFKFITSDGTEREESGKFEGEGNYVVRGYYSFIDPEGEKHYVEYVADKTGYHATVTDATEPVLQALPPDVVATLVG